MRRIGIEVKLIIFISLLLLVSMFTLVITSKQRLEIIVDDQIHESNRLVLTSLQRTIPYLLEDNKLNEIQRMIENTGASKAIAVLRVFSPESIVIASASPLEVNKRIDNDLISKIVDDKKLVAESQFCELALPVHGMNYDPRSDSDIQAVLYIQAENGYFLRTLDPFQNAVIQIAVVITLVLVLTSLLFLKVTLKDPLKKLMHAITEVENGNYQPELAIKSPWEFSKFTEMFLKMLNRIEEQNKELSGYSDMLEIMVTKRTRELDTSIQKLKEAQNTIIHQEKMASIGQLAAGVAHEINNPTGFVMGNLSVLNEYLDSIKNYYLDSLELIRNYDSGTAEAVRSFAEKLKDTGEKEELEMIFDDIGPLMEELNRGTTRIKDIVHGLKNFARPDSGKYRMSDLNEGLEDALKISWNKLKYNAEVVKVYGEIPPIYCNIQQLEQVFINLLTNASDAIEKNGLIKIKTSSDEKNVYITIEDNGKGIPQKDLQKIFDPFFTTKDIGSGTGLGLSISHGIIERHNGKLEVESRQGEGSSFLISLPINRSGV